MQSLDAMRDAIYFRHFSTLSAQAPDSILEETSEAISLVPDLLSAMSLLP